MWEKRTGSPVIYLQSLSIQYRMNSGTLLGEIAALKQALNLWPKRVKTFVCITGVSVLGVLTLGQSGWGQYRC